MLYRMDWRTVHGRGGGFPKPAGQLTPDQVSKKSVHFAAFSLQKRFLSCHCHNGSRDRVLLRRKFWKFIWKWVHFGTFWLHKGFFPRIPCTLLLMLASLYVLVPTCRQFLWHLPASRADHALLLILVPLKELWKLKVESVKSFLCDLASEFTGFR